MANISFLVGPDMYQVNANKEVLQFASPVFAKMLTSGFKESNMDKIELPEDDPTALEILFDLAHYRVPSKPNSDDLKKVAICMDKYGFRAGSETIKSWILETMSSSDLVTIGSLIEAACIINNCETFKVVTAKAVLDFSSFEELLEVESTQGNLWPRIIRKPHLPSIASLYRLSKRTEQS